MIPKIIHLCWLSGDPYPPEIQKCLNSWKKHLPDYEIWLWDTKRFDINSTDWTRQAFDAHKYAFAADYIRLYALYNYGGIYLDSDVLIYKSFDPLLSLPYFIGCDQIRAFEAAVIGCEKGCKWIKDILDSYIGKQFIKSDGSLDMLTLPCRFHDVLTSNGYRFFKINNVDSFNFNSITLDKKEMYVFNKDYFNSRNEVEVHRKETSFCAHNYMGSWEERNNNIKKHLPKWLLSVIFKLGRKTWAHNKYKWLQIPFSN